MTDNNKRNGMLLVDTVILMLRLKTFQNKKWEQCVPKKHSVLFVIVGGYFTAISLKIVT